MLAELSQRLLSGRGGYVGEEQVVYEPQLDLAVLACCQYEVITHSYVDVCDVHVVRVL